MAAGVTMNVRARESGASFGGKPAIREGSSPVREGKANALKVGVDTSDWQSVVKDMLSIHLPTSRMAPRPIVTTSSPSQAPPAPTSRNNNSSAFAEESKRALKVPEVESLQSGSPRASRSPIGLSSPRSTCGSGLLLVRIDESEALDTTSDCSAGSEHGDELDIMFRQMTPPSRSANEGLNNFIRKSRHAAPVKSSPLRVSGTGDEDFPEHRKSDSSGDSSTNMDPISHCIGFEFADATCPPRTLKSDPSSAPSPSTMEDVPRSASNPLSKYRPDAMPLRRPDMAPKSDELQGRMMRRSVMSRISDHGCEEDEDGRVEFEEERLALDSLRREVADRMLKGPIAPAGRSSRPLASGRQRRQSDSSQAFSWAGQALPSGALPASVGQGAGKPLQN